MSAITGTRTRAGAGVGAAMHARWARLMRALRLERPRPRVEVGIGRAVPAWVLRAFLVVVGVGCTAVVALNATQWTLTAVVLAAVLIRPLPVLQAVLVLSWGVGLTLATTDPAQPSAFALLFGVHLFAVLGRFVGGLSWSARVEVRALRRPALRFGAIQAFAQVLALAGAWLSGAGVAAAWVAVLAGVALAAAAWFVLRRIAFPGPASPPPSTAPVESSREDGWSYRLHT
ncbi:hypothetical protein [Planctomonas psychrotolerans]|uniref:hypothetical protein n=1 Tax=Planctomonas psychrotolerans TaxID=2528712 RepID=UPI00123999F4|nr:hypothetical protein [Planctomonas psychrotolerans]